MKCIMEHWEQKANHINVIRAKLHEKCVYLEFVKI